jgi:hypothetical protein
MKCSGQLLFTPLYLKLNDAMPWPEQEKAFYLLSSDGLYLCRNTPFFRSCVPVEDFPSELAGQKPFLKLSYPRIPRRLMEQVIGFFDLVGERHASEAAVLIGWNRTTNSVQIIVPDQVGLVGTTCDGNPYPMELEYEVPPLPPHLLLLGDIHSHVDGPAYASYMDKSDEAHRPGLHFVIGRILDEPPQIYCEATTDGFRFKVPDLSLVLEGYHRRRVKEVPPEWISKVTVKPWSSKHRFDANSQANSRSSSGTSSFQSAGGYMLPARHEGLEAMPLTPEDRTDGARASLPVVTPPPEAHRNDDAGLLAKPPAPSNSTHAPQTPRSSDRPPTP